MNWADYCIIGLIALSALMGLWRGLIGEMLALACWIAAAWVAWTYGPRVAEALTAVDLPSARILLGYVTCFLAVLILGAIVSFLIRKLIAGTGLSGTDRLFGMVFGFARGFALVAVIVLLLGFTPLPRDPWWHASLLLPTFQRAAQWAGAHMPPDVGQYLDLHGLLPALPVSPMQTPPSSSPPPQTAPAPASGKRSNKSIPT